MLFLLQDRGNGNTFMLRLIRINIFLCTDSCNIQGTNIFVYSYQLTCIHPSIAIHSERPCRHVIYLKYLWNYNETCRFFISNCCYNNWIKERRKTRTHWCYQSHSNHNPTKKKISKHKIEIERKCSLKSNQATT